MKRNQFWDACIHGTKVVGIIFSFVVSAAWIPLIPMLVLLAMISSNYARHCVKCRGTFAPLLSGAIWMEPIVYSMYTKAMLPKATMDHLITTGVIVSAKELPALLKIANSLSDESLNILARKLDQVEDLKTERSLAKSLMSHMLRRGLSCDLSILSLEDLCYVLENSNIDVAKVDYDFRLKIGYQVRQKMAEFKKLTDAHKELVVKVCNDETVEVLLAENFNDRMLVHMGRNEKAHILNKMLKETPSAERMKVLVKAFQGYYFPFDSILEETIVRHGIQPSVVRWVLDYLSLEGRSLNMFRLFLMEREDAVAIKNGQLTELLDKRDLTEYGKCLLTSHKDLEAYRAKRKEEFPEKVLKSLLIQGDDGVFKLLCKEYAIKIAMSDLSYLVMARNGII